MVFIDILVKLLCCSLKLCNNRLFSFYRTELREKIRNEGVALRMEQDQQEKYERKIIKQKVNVAICYFFYHFLPFLKLSV